jgi:ribosomal peptide maturation radical SAM protein 1
MEGHAQRSSGVECRWTALTVRKNNDEDGCCNASRGGGDMPLTIQLINMPFGAVQRPSIALTQLKAVVEAAYGDAVEVHIRYLNHEFARILGRPLYDFIAGSDVGGLGEWLFRGAAFPELPDNGAEYFSRYRHHFDPKGRDHLERQLNHFRKSLDEILDAQIYKHGIHEADVVGLTSMFFQNLPSIALAQRLERINPAQIVLMGGANCEGSMGIELVTNVPVLDFVFSGNSLISFPKLIGHLLAAEMAECHHIDGVFSRKNARSISELIGDNLEVDWGKLKPGLQLNGVAALGREKDINEPIELDYDSFLESAEVALAGAPVKPVVMFETSRGCWWGERAHCTFCGLNGGTMAYRAMRPELAVALLEGLIARYGDRVDIFESVDNILPTEYIEGVFARLRPPQDVSLFYEVKADLTEPDLRTLAAGGVRRIQPGIEALATSTLKIMRKGTTAFHGVRLLSYCRKYGVTPFWNLLIGFPGETAEVYEKYAQMLPTLFHLPPPVGVFPVRFDRYSPYHTLERQYGLSLAPYDFYALCYPFRRTALRNMAYYFQDTTADAPYLRDVSSWISPLREITERWRRLWDAGGARPSLELVEEESGITVEDSRDGVLRRRGLSKAAAQIIMRAQQPERSEAFVGCEDSLEELEQSRVLFKERGKILSLVSPSPP